MSKVYILVNEKQIADDIVKISKELYNAEANIISDIGEFQIEITALPKQLLEIGMYIGMNTYINVTFSEDKKLYTIGRQLLNDIAKANKVD